MIRDFGDVHRRLDGTIARQHLRLVVLRVRFLLSGSPADGQIATGALPVFGPDAGADPVKTPALSFPAKRAVNGTQLHGQGRQGARDHVYGSRHGRGMLDGRRRPCVMEATLTGGIEFEEDLTDDTN